MKKIFNYTLKYSGLNFVNFVNFLIKNNIGIYDIKKINNKEFDFKITNNNYKKYKKLDSIYNISIVRTGGFKNLLFTLLKRMGVLIGSIVIVVTGIIWNKKITSIRVMGETMYSEKIVESVKNYGIEIGESFNFDNEDLEKYLLENIEEISLISVKKQGNIILINAMDKQQDNDTYEPFYAPYNMVIKDITLISGTLNVSKNDVIKKGDILVDSFTISSTGERLEVPARAKIIADVWFCGSEIAMKQNIIYEKTGNKTEYKSIYFKTIKDNEILSPYSNYVSESIIININNNYFLPIYQVKQTFYETKEVVQTFDFENEKDEYLEKSKQKAYTNLPKNVIIQETNQNISELSDRYIFQTYLKTTMEINNEN